MKRADDLDSREEEPKIPEALTVDFDGIPKELQGYPFVFWRYEVVDKDVKKPPFNPKTGKRASVADESTWGSFDDAREVYISQRWGKADRIGIVLPENGNLVAVDIDDCIEKGNIKPHAMDITLCLHFLVAISQAERSSYKASGSTPDWNCS